MSSYQNLVGRLYSQDGSYIENPHYVDYGDGAGLQICGGNVFDKNGAPIGHADPPGPRGTPGAPGAIH